MTLFEMSPDQVLLLSTVLAKCMGEYYDLDDLNILGNFFVSLGSNMELIIASKQAHLNKLNDQNKTDFPPD